MADQREIDLLALGRPDRATDRSRTVIHLAVEAADEFSDPCIDSCHLLCGLFREGHGIAAHVLRHLGLDREQLDSAMRSRTPNPCKPAKTIADDLAVVMNAAMDSVSRLKHSYYGTEHLLLGTMAERTQSVELIRQCGIKPADVTHEVFGLLGHLP